MKRHILAPAVFTLAVAMTAWGQGRGGGGGGGNTGGGNTGGNTGGNQGQQGQSQNQDPFGQQRQSQQVPRPIYLSGQVVLDNGEAPPEPVTIMRICSGQRTPETYTNSKGDFSFQVGGDPTLAMTDASVSGFGGAAGGQFGQGAFGGSRGFGQTGNAGLSGDGMSVDLSDCELQAELPGFRSDILQLGRRRTLDNPDIGTIVLHRLDGFTGAVVSATTLSAPKNARSSYDKAMREMSKKSGSKPEKAISELQKAVDEYPQFAAAWTLMGEAYFKTNQPDKGAAALEKAIEADPAYMRPYGPLVQHYISHKDWAKTAETADALLAMNPAQTQVHYYKALGLYGSNQFDDAMAVARQIQEGPDAKSFPQTHQMIGMIQQNRGEFEEAATEYRRYLEKQPNAPSAAEIKKQLMEWEVLGVINPVKSASAQ